MAPRKYTTGEAAEEVKITRATLQAWIAQRRIRAPKPSFRGAVGVRLWTPADVERLRRLKAKIYRKRRGRKKGK